MYSPVCVSGIPYMTRTKGAKALRQKIMKETAALRASLPQHQLPPLKELPKVARKKRMLGGLIPDNAEFHLKFGESRSSRGLRGEEISAPAAVSDRLPPVRKAQIVTMKDRTRITHREYISDVKESVVFECNSLDVGEPDAGLPINPGLPTLFPWLSGVAASYESYRFERLQFEYRTLSSTDKTGTVILAVDLDVTDPAPTGKAEVMSFEGAVRSVPWGEITCPVSIPQLADRPRNLFVRTGDPPAGSDQKLYDLGQLFACTEGQSGTTDNIGEVYVTYVVDLFTPSAEHESASGSETSTYSAVYSSKLDANGASSPWVISSESFTQEGPGSGGATLSFTGDVGALTGTLTGLAPGDYHLSFGINGTSSATGTLQKIYPTVSGSSVLHSMLTEASNSGGAQGSAGFARLRCVDPADVVTFDLFNEPCNYTTLTDCDISVMLSKIRSDSGWDPVAPMATSRMAQRRTPYLKASAAKRMSEGARVGKHAEDRDREGCPAPTISTSTLPVATPPTARKR